ncbi:MAG: Ig-like domain-containing protein [Myxococcota bacterium]
MNYAAALSRIVPLAFAVTLINCGDGTKSANEAPKAPVISAPADASTVTNPVTVTGTGEVGATVNIELRQGSTTIGTATSTVDSAGNFSIIVAYTAPSNGAAMTLDVTLSNTHGTFLCHSGGPRAWGSAGRSQPDGTCGR